MTACCAGTRRPARSSVFRKPSNNANGNTRDRQGRLITCEHQTRRVTRTEYDGTITVICDNYEGKRLNSPNDVVVKSDGSIWFTDPRFGILGNYEGDIAEPELPMNVYRVDGANRRGDGRRGRHQRAERARLLARRKENLHRGIARRAAHHSRLRCLGRGRQDCQPQAADQFRPQGTPDGFRVDVDGNLWCGWGMSPELDGVRVFTPQGEPIGHISLPERCANVCFGGKKRNRLFMAAAHSLYSLYVNTQGVAGG